MTEEPKMAAYAKPQERREPTAAGSYEVARRMRRLRNILAVVWMVVTGVTAFISPLFSIGSAVGWALASLVATAAVGQMEAERHAAESL